ncbi:MAG: serine/threonine protein kinase [Candidatus Xenobiia bacterium LiM19]
MGFRIPAPDGKKDRDGHPVFVLPYNTEINGSYTVSYFTAGGMSVAYKGIKDGLTYFIKEVESTDCKRVTSLMQEMEILERLNHPGIVKVYDFFEYDGFYYLVQEFIDGQTLERLISPIQNVFLQERVILEWTSQILDIIEYLHRQSPRIIYRDLKPSNIIRDKNGRIHLVDFGIARLYREGKSKDTESMGSALTASPEHYGRAQTDVRSDIFTIGATLHYLATNGRDRSEIPFEYEAVRSINPKISPDLEYVIHKALDLNPEKRFQSIAELRAAMSGFQSINEMHGAHLQSGEPSLRSDAGSGHYSENARGTVRSAGTVGAETATMELDKGDKKGKRFPVSALLAVVAVVLFFAGSYYQNRDQFSNKSIELGNGGVFKFYNGKVRITVPKGYLIDEGSVMNFPLKDKTALAKRDSKGVLRIVQLLIVDQFPPGITIEQAANLHINNRILAEGGAKIVSRKKVVINNINCYEIIHTIKQMLPDGSSNQPANLIIRQLFFTTGHKNDICFIIAITQKENYTKVSREFDGIFNSLELKK